MIIAKNKSYFKPLEIKFVFYLENVNWQVKYIKTKTFTRTKVIIKCPPNCNNNLLDGVHKTLLSVHIWGKFWRWKKFTFKIHFLPFILCNGDAMPRESVAQGLIYYLLSKVIKEYVGIYGMKKWLICVARLANMWSSGTISAYNS